ncbi:hypothetical protein AJ78_02243 [Emergomyces pasteurianus Ep9510]|uniref:Uncharacterized protein n=1 Tax=Emergomyces pasteurianus Ep9510 TaxID=1447872 RepID=A0A1J9QP53_9EURO|nr:hypothetical protein AJ78_02243 [Emergomyces pasteurianus Ep9510]
MNPSLPQPLREQHSNVNLSQLLIDTFDKVGKESGAGGLETSKWAVRHPQQQLPQQSQFGSSGLGAPDIDHKSTNDDGKQPPPLCSPHHCENSYGGSRVEGWKKDNHRAREASPPNVKVTTSTRDGNTSVLRITGVDMNVDIASLHALVGQCIDPGLERIVDVWEVGDVSVPHDNLTLQLERQSDAILIITPPVALLVKIQG